MTGSLDEVAIAAIRDRLEDLAELDKRRAAVVKSLTERDLLTFELTGEIERADTLSVLEDIYLPFRPKRRTRATIVRDPAEVVKVLQKVTVTVLSVDLERKRISLSMKQGPYDISAPDHETLHPPV